MITEEGVVQQIIGAKALVAVNRTSACAGCHSQSVCMPSENKEALVEAINDIEAGVGDRVQISIPSGSLLKGAFLVYLLPVLALIGGTLIGRSVAPPLQAGSSLAPIACGLLAMGIVFGTVKWLDRLASSNAKYWPRVTQILSSTEPPLKPLSSDDRK